MSSSITKPGLRLRLIAMAKADQDMRNGFLRGDGAWDGAVDQQHTAALKRIIARHGWPTIPMVGIEASNDAWLIAQHADHDLAFQKECLALLKAVPAGAVSLRNIAYLEDRVFVAEQQPQLYGTQFEGAGADLKARPILDAVHVDERRKQMGLETLEDYWKLMLETYQR